ncbi:DNA mismatch repair endonuclease MutH [Salinimonas chungwhensis]|uniref:DNA mismatch repair endonuclease MutH n=1 Tax=Salinimonas chungwhensis TaxID=265425 RepID=UPI000379F3C1|nr:DNA mismatch repair endonuclease MutH [Salinimonas chungwhensis]
MQPPSSAPRDINELLARCQKIAGLSLGELAGLANVAVPENLQRHKGWQGQLLELWLGATAGSRPQQDFPELGVELKTLPVDSRWQVRETTYVCYAPLMNPPGVTWPTSNVRNKLSRVLWLPLEGDRKIPVSQRRVGNGFLWTPCGQEEALLQKDWEELTEMIVLGQVEKITARHGNALHLRPKAANGSILTDALGPEGDRIKTRPRGFYLRKTFTQALLINAFS